MLLGLSSFELIALIVQIAIATTTEVIVYIASFVIIAQAVANATTTAHTIINVLSRFLNLFTDT